jgi:glycosyltransferase involved in cell wall biosynthesis
MKIALIGEFSSLHNNLAIALKKKGHNVILVNDGDSFKNYNRDLDIRGNGSNLYFRNLSRIFKEIKLIFIIKDFDVVQYMNPADFSRFGPAKTIFKFLKKRNLKTFLLAAGDDYYYWEAYRKGKYKYSLHEISLKIDIEKSKSIWEKFRLKKTTVFLTNFVDAVIPTALMYKIAYDEHPNCVEMINFPITIQSESLPPINFKTNEKIRIMHGGQTNRIALKGTDLIDSAMGIIQRKYPERVEYIRIQDLPFDQYKIKISEAHVVIDQVYGYEPGMNALICMQHGKLVLGGYEQELREINNIDYEPLINITPSIDDIVSKVEMIIKNPEMIKTFYLNSRKYVEEFHSSDIIAEKYLKIWK